MQLGRGFEYFFSGFPMITEKGLKRFVLIPLLINLVIFGTSLFFIYGWLTDAFAWVNAQLPEWLSWLEWLLWPLALLVVLFSYSMIFTVITNFIAAPFNGILAEKVELHLTGQRINDDGLLDTMRDVPRMLGREWTKLCYYLPRAIGFFILMWLLPVIGQIIWALFTCWMFAIQYKDYAFDNHKVSFRDMKRDLNAHRGLSYGFGAGVMLCAMIPILNMIVMPVAVCGATKLWVENYRNNYRGQ
ncbi:sulfate transporter CysZ [Pseudoalteromonas sp. T1lg48]|uniref:sulfate transporter CysZ n=1 Tax=Pseudoalteromonas sp. T1lg48 TaxID=2077100 RepID=UPI000CF7294E|nr:sulfate transporter CysZ [Pseudoalteromonas sp. T1lg48]